MNDREERIQKADEQYVSDYWVVHRHIKNRNQKHGQDSMPTTETITQRTLTYNILLSLEDILNRLESLEDNLNLLTIEKSNP